MAKGEETYQKMMDVSIYYFAKDGIQKTSFSKIADALHMTKPSLYYYVKSKDELVQKVFDYIYEDYNFSAYFEKLPSKANEIEAFLLEGGLQFIQEIEDYSILINLLNEFAIYANRVKAKDDSYFDKISKAQQSFVEGFEQALKKAGVSQEERLIKAQTLALILDNIQSYQLMGVELDANQLWRHAVKQALK